MGYINRTLIYYIEILYNVFYAVNIMTFYIFLLLIFFYTCHKIRVINSRVAWMIVNTLYIELRHEHINFLLIFNIIKYCFSKNGI